MASCVSYGKVFSLLGHGEILQINAVCWKYIFLSQFTIFDRTININKTLKNKRRINLLKNAWMIHHRLHVSKRVFNFKKIFEWSTLKLFFVYTDISPFCSWIFGCFQNHLKVSSSTDCRSFPKMTLIFNIILAFFGTFYF